MELIELIESKNLIGKYCRYLNKTWMVYIITDYYEYCKKCDNSSKYICNVEDGTYIKTCINCRLYHPNIDNCPFEAFDINKRNCLNCYGKIKKFVNIKNKYKTFDNISIEVITVIDSYVPPKNRFDINKEIRIKRKINGINFFYIYNVKSFEIFYDTISYELEDVLSKKIERMDENIIINLMSV